MKRIDHFSVSKREEELSKTKPARHKTKEFGIESRQHKNRLLEVGESEGRKKEEERETKTKKERNSSMFLITCLKPFIS